MVIARGGYRVAEQIVAAANGSASALSSVNERFEDLFRWVGRASAWETWSPTFNAGVTVGNGDFDGSAYVVVGETCFFRFFFTLGSTSSITGTVSVNLPFVMANARDADGFTGLAEENGATWWPAHGLRLDTSSCYFRIATASGSYAQSASPASTVPFTWGTDDSMTFAGTYQIAT